MILQNESRIHNLIVVCLTIETPPSRIEFHKGAGNPNERLDKNCWTNK